MNIRTNQALASAVKIIFISFHRANNSARPTRIIFRDGISEGQSREVLCYEVNTCLGGDSEHGSLWSVPLDACFAVDAPCFRLVLPSLS